MYKDADLLHASSSCSYTYIKTTEQESLQGSTLSDSLRTAQVSLPAVTLAVDSASGRLDPPGTSLPNGWPTITKLPLKEDCCH
jgi:hypothetical protein